MSTFLAPAAIVVALRSRSSSPETNKSSSPETNRRPLRNSSPETNNRTYDFFSNTNTNTNDYRYSDSNECGCGLFELFSKPFKTSRSRKCELQMRCDLSAFKQHLYKQNRGRRLTIASWKGKDVVEFLRSLDESEETYKVHDETCMFFGNLRPPKCTCQCPQKPTWHNIVELVHRMAAEFIKNGGSPSKNPFEENDVLMYTANKSNGKCIVKT